MSINQALLGEFDHEMANTRKVLERLTPEHFPFKPHEKSGTLIWLASHLAMISHWGYTTMTTPELTLTEFTPPPTPTTTEELLAGFDKQTAEFRESLEKATDADMMHVWTMTWMGQQVISMPRVAVLRGMVMNHLIHHRGQLTVYMRLCGIPVPGMYGPSADEMPAQASA